MDSLGLYVHFPWCATRCTYCDFNTYVVDRIPADRYTRIILREGSTRAPAWAEHQLTTIYFGGGTPSLWGAEGIGAVIEAARQWFPRRADRLEITMECNPAEADPKLLDAVLQVGVNRLSLGVQSLDDEILTGLGRRHDSATARRALDAALQTGFDSVSADLMFGLPGQTTERWTNDLKHLCETGVPHLSLYHLTLEPGTPITRDVKAGRVELPSEDTVADMWEALEPTVAAFGLHAYEISNAARPGHESRHNTQYWTGRPYLGLGAGAHSMRPPADWSADGATVVRELNRKHHVAFADQVEADGAAVEDTERLDRMTHLRERMFTGLRRRVGLDVRSLHRELGLDPLQVFEGVLSKLHKRELLWRRDGRLGLTPTGVRYADDVFVEFF